MPTPPPPKSSPFIPANISSEPILTPGEKAVVKAYGGWTPFMQSMGLKPWEDADAKEGKQIAASFAAADKGDESQQGGGGSKSNAK